MAQQITNGARLVLLAAVILLLCMTAYSYFRTGEVSFSIVAVALCCLVVFLVTGRRRDAGKQ